MYKCLKAIAFFHFVDVMQCGLAYGLVFLISASYFCWLGRQMEKSTRLVFHVFIHSLKEKIKKRVKLMTSNHCRSCKHNILSVELTIDCDIWKKK